MRNRAFSYEAAPDLLVITCIADNKLGNLFFLKRFFLKKNIENTKSNRKMAMRIYPVWDTTVSNQAKRAKRGNFNILLI